MYNTHTQDTDTLALNMKKTVAGAAVTAAATGAVNKSSTKIEEVYFYDQSKKKAEFRSNRFR